MTALWSILFGFLPLWFQQLILVVIAISLLVLLIRVVAGILEAIPFL